MDGPFKKSVRQFGDINLRGSDTLRKSALSVVKNKQNAKTSGHAGRGAFKEADTFMCHRQWGK